MKGVYRHYSTVLLFVGIMVSFVAFLNGVNIYQQIKYALAEVNEYNYQFSYYIGISDIKDMNATLGKLSELPGNVIITDCIVFLDTEEVYHECEIILSQEEDLPYPVDWINKNGELIIGEELEDLCFESDGVTYISIDGSNMSIAGYVSSAKSNLLDYKVILTTKVENLNENLLDSDSLTVEYSSNEHSITENVRTFYNENCENVNIYYEESTEKYIDVASSSGDEEFYMIIALFATVNCIVISEFWILRRKNEIIIRKLWGFTNIKIFKMLYGQMMIIAASGVVIVLLGQFVLSLVNKAYGEISLNRLGISILFMVISALVIVMLPVYKASHFKISEGLEM